METNWRVVLASTRLVRAMGESLLVGAVLWVALYVLHGVLPFSLFPFGLSRVAPSIVIIGLSLLVGPICLCWFSARLQSIEGNWCLRYVVDGLLGGFVIILLCGMEFAFTNFFLENALPAAEVALLGKYSAVTFLFPSLMLDMFSFVVFRAAIRVARMWNRLRRTHLLWSLTNAHMIVLALGAVLLIVLIEFLVSRNSFNLTLIVPTTIGLVIVSIVVLAIILPPLALFSYVVMRRTTDRLRLLMKATGELRRGNYEVRVPVVGEDEVAQLQADFNAMATNLELAMRDLKNERDTIAALLQSRRELIANVSHELRTPMSTLRGYLETALAHWDEQPQTTLLHDLQIMESEAIRLQHLVEDLFALSAAEVGKLTMQCKPTDVGQLVEHVVATAAPLAWRASRIEVAADVPASIPLLRVDPNRLEQALQNLLHNAIRHTAPGGIVAIAATMEARTVSIHVKDTGEGIAPEDLPHIWERFYQSESARARSDRGAGLGLSLVKEWIEAMGGTVCAESIVGAGSCFTLCLPQA
jgi:signal transduction histidine kinase